MLAAALIPLMFAIGLLFLFVKGPGAWSIDQYGGDAATGQSAGV